MAILSAFMMQMEHLLYKGPNYQIKMMHNSKLSRILKLLTNSYLIKSYLNSRIPLEQEKMKSLVLWI